jgi:ammonium transporter Rh
MYDAGGSATIHVFGAYFGVVTSYILGKSVQPKSKPESTYNSNLFALIGTLFFWMFWPSFNAGVYTTVLVDGTDRINVITNTIVALTGSCLGAYMFSGFFRDKFSMEDILRSTLAGGVIIAAPCRVIINPAASLVIGLLAGIISGFLYKHLNKTLEEKGFYDTCGVHTLHGIIGILGGILSAICVSYYQKFPLDDAVQAATYPWYSLRTDRNFYGQGGIQIAGTFISLGIGIAAGIVAGILCKLVYVFEAEEFYRDDIYF